MVCRGGEVVGKCREIGKRYHMQRQLASTHCQMSELYTCQIALCSRIIKLPQKTFNTLFEISNFILHKVVNILYICTTSTYAFGCKSKKDTEQGKKRICKVVIFGDDFKAIYLNFFFPLGLTQWLTSTFLQNSQTLASGTQESTGEYGKFPLDLQ